MTHDYRWLYDTVRKRFESDEAMEAFLPEALTPDELKQKGDDRYLSAMSQRVFQAGMQHSMVDAKWPAFEEAFWGFVPLKTPNSFWIFARSWAAASVSLSPACRVPTSSTCGIYWPNAALA
ncbi:hypothetical protein [Billgrantia endophytica]|uniref:hypothetical protein n=1 Tax=Billgrantia endophytica TaxID=2033802 RepID=UPI001F0C2A58|nr:hypothetical protein [Halomonas endophytica]